MRFCFLTSAPWPTSGGNRFAWYSRGRRAFVLGEHPKPATHGQLKTGH